MLKVKENYFKAKNRPADILLNFHAMICFKFKLHLKFRNYYFILVNFLTGL